MTTPVLVAMLVVYTLLGFTVGFLTDVAFGRDYRDVAAQCLNSYQSHLESDRVFLEGMK